MIQLDSRTGIAVQALIRDYWQMVRAIDETVRDAALEGSPWPDFDRPISGVRQWLADHVPDHVARLQRDGRYRRLVRRVTAVGDGLSRLDATQYGVVQAEYWHEPGVRVYLEESTVRKIRREIVTTVWRSLRDGHVDLYGEERDEAPAG